MWDHAYITHIQINYTCSINSPFPSSPLMYKLRSQKCLLNACLGYSHFSDALLTSVYWTRMEIKIGKGIFIVCLLWKRNQTEWTDYCISGDTDLVLACRRDWLEWGMIWVGSLHLWWIINHSDLLFKAGGRAVAFLSFDSGKEWNIHRVLSTRVARVILIKVPTGCKSGTSLGRRWGFVATWLFNSSRWREDEWELRMLEWTISWMAG